MNRLGTTRTGAEAPSRQMTGGQNSWRYDPPGTETDVDTFALLCGNHLLHLPPASANPTTWWIYLGGDKILQAPETGQKNVGYGTLSEFPEQTATVRRTTVPINGPRVWWSLQRTRRSGTRNSAR